MIRTPDTSTGFLPVPADRILLNPHIGFTTFQRGAGDPLNPELGITEGWRKEILRPVGSYAQTLFDADYPASTVAYWRFCWKDFEPREGEFDFEYVERLLEYATSCGQTSALRMMPHTTRAVQDVPEWLKEKIPTPERPDNARVKESPTDPEFYHAFARAVRALGERFDGDPRIETMDMSLCGAWGEGHNVEFVPEKYIRELVDAHTRSFTKTPLMGQISSVDAILYANESVPMGFRADCLGDMNYHMVNFYPRAIARMAELWKRAPVSFEVCWTMSYWKERGWDIDYIAGQALKWHGSTFNAKSARVPHAFDDGVRRWLCRMGYRLALRRLDHPSRGSSGDTLRCGMWMENTGCAPLYHPYDFVFRLRREGASDIMMPTGLDPRTWLPGDTVTEFTLGIPQGTPKGEYLLEAGLVTPGKTDAEIMMAMRAPESGKFYTLGTFAVE